MIASIRGKVSRVQLDGAIIETHGIGYWIYLARPENFTLDQEVYLFIHHQIREDEQALFGFSLWEEYQFFTKLISVKGVGAKTALGILAYTSVDKLIQSIENSDVNELKRLPGIGAKTASQIILDLKGKLVSVHTIERKQDKLTAIDETIEGLKSLGYKASELQSLHAVLKEYQSESPEQLLKRALQHLSIKKGI